MHLRGRARGLHGDGTRAVLDVPLAGKLRDSSREPGTGLALRGCGLFVVAEQRVNDALGGVADGLFLWCGE